MEVQVFRRGKYKSASDSFRLKKLDPANREQWDAYYTALDKDIRESIASGFGKSSGDLEVLVSGKNLVRRRGPGRGLDQRDSFSRRTRIRMEERENT